MIISFWFHLVLVALTSFESRAPNSHETIDHFFYFSIQPSCKKYASLARIFSQELQDLAVLHWNEACLQEVKNFALSCKKNCKIIFFQSFDQILQENYLGIPSCKINANVLFSCEKSFICERIWENKPTLSHPTLTYPHPYTLYKSANQR